MNQRLLEAMGWRSMEPMQYWAEGYGWDAHVKSFRGTSPSGIEDCEVPDYANDDAACLDALDATGHTWGLRKIRDDLYVCTIHADDEVRAHSSYQVR